MIFADAITVKMQLDAVRGPQGEQGIPGPVGPVGPRGIQGERGLRGESAYEGAIRLNLTNLSEEDWLREYDTKRDNAIKAIEDAGEQAESDVQQESASALSAIEAKKNAALAEIPADYTQLAADVNRLKGIKADAIIDTSSKAASHTLHAQDAPMNITLYGATTQAGNGDPSPDNVRPISGVDVAIVHCGGKNLIDIVKAAQLFEDTNDDIGNYGTFADGVVTIKRNFASHGRIFLAGQTIPVVAGASYTISADVFFPADASDLRTTLSIGTGYKNISGVSAAETWERVQATFVAPNTECVKVSCLGTRTSNMQFKNLQVEIGDTATPYEPYNANVIDMTAALNGEALYGDGTVMDTVENDVPSGCDKCVILDGTQSNKLSITELTNTVRVSFDDLIDDKTPQGGYPSHLFTSRFHKVVAFNDDYEHMYSNVHGTVLFFINKTKLSSVDEAGIKEYFAANPLHVYYRSTEYTPEKDLRVCKVTKKTKCATLDGSLVVTSTWPTHEGRLSYQYPKFTDWRAHGSFTGAKEIGYWLGEIWALTNPTNDRVFTNWSRNVFNFTISESYTLEDVQALLDGTKFVYELKTPEVYYTDPHELRKPTGLMPVTVTGSGETEVEYSCDTKSYIDRKFDALAAALIGG